jgi:GT2 family glycosyltransferase
MATTPFVRAVVVNFNGGEMTLRCLDGLAALEWPAERLELVLVDNASTDGIAERVAEERGRVRLVRNHTNLGFAGGCNVALDDLDGVDYVALVNNDAVVEPGWLAPLVGALEADPALGAANGKVLFAPRFTEVVVESDTFVPGRGDARRLGVRVSGVEVDGRDVTSDCLFPSGFWDLEHGAGEEASFRWTDGRGQLLVPATPGTTAPRSCCLRLASASPRGVSLSAGPGRARAGAGPTPAWVDCPLEGPWTDVVNSAGGLLLKSGHGADRAFLEPDDGRWDEPVEVFSWTGSAVVLRAAYLRDAGLFDDRFFLYYEDLDLSWRGRLRGWRYAYVPAAVARHLHGATSGRGSALLLHHLERNRLLTLTRNAPFPLLARALADFLRVTAVASGREALNSLLIGHGLAANVLRQRLRVLGSYLRLAPATVVDRARTGRRVAGSRAALVKRWAVDR